MMFAGSRNLEWKIVWPDDIFLLLITLSLWMVLFWPQNFIFQGSHVTSQPGSYILQWKLFDSAKSFDILSTHKSKVMYYNEVLPSEQFRYELCISFSKPDSLLKHVTLFKESLKISLLGWGILKAAFGADRAWIPCKLVIPSRFI